MAKEEVKPEIFDEIKKKVKEEAHKEYTTFVGFIGVVIRTFNPLSYKKICMASFGQGLLYFFHILVFSFILFFLFTIPYMFNFYDELREETNNLNNFTIAPQMDVNQIITFDDFGIVVANEKPYDGEFLLLTQQSVYWKNNLCIFSRLACLFNNDPHQLDFSQAHTLIEDREKFSNLAFTFILLMLPGIFILLFLYLLVKYFAVVLLFFLFGFIYTTAIRYEVHARQLFLVAIFSLTPTILTETIFGLYYETYYVPYAASLLLFMVSTYMVSEKPFHHFKHPH